MGRPAPIRHRGRPYRPKSSRGCHHDLALSSTNAPCPWGMCTQWVCPVDGMIQGGFGPMGCPCDHLPAWHRPFLDQMNKPHPPIKVAGRRADRIRNSKVMHDKGETYAQHLGELFM